MPYVIAEPCVATCDQACVAVCPVDCIAGPLTAEEVEAIPHVERRVRLATIQLYIDPDACICCAACQPECPVDAIFDEGELPPGWEHYAERNAAFFRERDARSG